MAELGSFLSDAPCPDCGLPLGFTMTQRSMSSDARGVNVEVDVLIRCACGWRPNPMWLRETIL